jgi:YbbR domain-containing protein
MDKWLNQPMVVRIVSVLLAIMLWFVVNGSSPNPVTTTEITQNEIRIDNAALEVRYDERKVALLEAPQTVDLILRGSQRDLSLFRLRDYKVYADVTGFGPGEVRVPVQFDGFPPNLHVEANPAEVRIVLEARESKSMPVDVEWLGMLPEGFQLGSPLIRPAEVRIGGGKSLLDRVVSVKAYVHLNARGEHLIQEVSLRAVDAQGNSLDVDIQPATVRVEVPIRSPRKTVPLDLQLQGRLPDGYSVSAVEMSPQEVTLIGPLAVLNKYHQYRGPTLDLTALKETQVLKLSVPIEKGLFSVEPAVIEVRVQISPSRTRVIEQLPIQVRGLPAGKEIKWLQPENGKLNLTLEGTGERLDALSANDVQVILDVSRLSEGEHRSRMEVKLPPFIQVKGLLPEARFLLQAAGSREPAGNQPEDVMPPERPPNESG